MPKSGLIKKPCEEAIWATVKGRADVAVAPPTR